MTPPPRRPPTGKAGPKKRPTGGRGGVAKKGKKVWHIFRFTERYELPDDVRYCRRSPLLYTKDFVGSGQDDESIAFHQQMTALRARPDRQALCAGFYDLKQIAANRSRAYRGYLLDERLGPAAEERIALWLGQDVKATRRILAGLAKVGLIELVEMPRFDPRDNDLPPKGGGGEAAKGGEPRRRAGSRAKTAAGSGRKTRKDRAEGGEFPGAPGNARNGPESPYARNGKGKEKVNLQSTSDKRQRETEKRTATATPKAKHAQGAKPQAEPSAPKLKCHQGRSEPRTPTADRGGAAIAPTATPPIVPTLADGTEGQGRAKSYAPPPPVRPPRIEHIYDPQAREFAAMIYEAMTVPYSAECPEAKRELANFASAWQSAQAAGLPPSTLRELWDKARKEAQAMAKKRRRTRFRQSPEACWRWLFNARLEAAKAGRASA